MRKKRSVAATGGATWRRRKGLRGITVGVSPDLHARLSAAAAGEGKKLAPFVVATLEEAAEKKQPKD